MAAETYTHGHHDSVLSSHRWRTAENSAAYLLGSLRSGQAVLDVGCGPGTISVDLARLVAPGVVVAADRAPGILDEVKQRTASAGVAVVAIAADVYHLPHADNTFDVVHAHQVLQHLSRPVAALQEMGRVCRPGGVVAARDADYRAMTWYPASPGLDEWMELYQTLARHNGGEPDAGRRVLSWAQAAGFAHVVPGASTWCYAVPSERQWWAQLWIGRLEASDFGLQARRLGLIDAAGVARLAAAWRQWAEAPDGWFSVPHGEVLCHVPDHEEGPVSLRS